MNEDHLVDGKEPRDEEIARLEELLSPLRYRKRVQARASVRTSPARRGGGLFVAATLVATAGVLAVVLWSAAQRPGGAPPEDRPGYTVVGLEGVSSLAVGGELVVGEDAEAASLEVGDLGHVAIDPGTRLSLIDSGERYHHLFLSEGSIEATIGLMGRDVFRIGTPAGLSIDQGCRYRVDVEEDGGTRISVSTGLVTFEGAEGGRVWVYAGSECRGRPGRGAGAPWWTADGNGRFARALDRIQFAESPDEQDLVRVLRPDVSRSTLTLWHLLRAESYETRTRVLRRLLDFIELPSGVTKAGLLVEDEPMLEAMRTKLEPYWLY